MSAETWRKKPVEVEVCLWDQTLTAYGIIYTWAEDAGRLLDPHGGHDDGTLHIETLEGEMVAQPGDYIIKGIKGEIYPCKPDIFLATYERCNVADQGGVV